MPTFGYPGDNVAYPPLADGKLAKLLWLYTIITKIHDKRLSKLKSFNYYVGLLINIVICWLGKERFDS